MLQSEKNCLNQNRILLDRELILEKPRKAVKNVYGRACQINCLLNKEMYQKWFNLLFKDCGPMVQIKFSASTACLSMLLKLLFEKIKYFLYYREKTCGML